MTVKVSVWVRTNLGMILLASSASAGHRFAIWAVSNCVKAGSRLSVLEAHTTVGNLYIWDSGEGCHTLELHSQNLSC